MRFREKFFHSVCCVFFAATVTAALTVTSAAAAVDSAKPAIQLAAGEQMAHKVVAGALGPWQQASVWLTQSDTIDDGPYSGRVAGADGSVHPLPPPDEPESAFMMKVRAVMFRNVDQDSSKELIVLFSAVRIGPQQTPYYAACVYKWSGTAFVRMTDVESRLRGARTAADVTQRLAVKPATRGAVK